MGYRDELDAARERIAMLEREVAHLHEVEHEVVHLREVEHELEHLRHAETSGGTTARERELTRELTEARRRAEVRPPVTRVGSVVATWTLVFVVGATALVLTMVGIASLPRRHTMPPSVAMPAPMPVAAPTPAVPPPAEPILCSFEAP